MRIPAAGPGTFATVIRFAPTASAMAAGLVLAAVLGGCGGRPSGPAVPDLPAGTVVDSGFRPTQNGLPFENYGEALANGATPSNMTATDVEKMFGSTVCADAPAGRCDLIPEAQDWLVATNQAMSGGHCYGFSVLADLLWQGRLTPGSFGAADVTGLRIVGNQVLQRQIAYDWALQTLPAVLSKRVTATPNKVLLILISTLRSNSPQAYTVVLWKPDGTGGHAVTPYAVRSLGGGKYDLLIYDNNWPGQTRAISFDTATNSWSYDASPAPGAPDSLYRGDAKTKTLALDPVSTAVGTQRCPFCGKVPNKPSSADTGMATVSLTGSAATHANLIVTDGGGHQLGYVGGRFVDRIPNAFDEPVISNADWTDRAEPDFYVPAGRRYTLTLDGSQLASADSETLNIVGPSFDLRVQNIVMRPGDRDTLVLNPDGTGFSYTSSRPETPTIAIGVSDRQADYSFRLAGLSEKPGNTLHVTLPPEGDTLGVRADAASTLRWAMTRETAQGINSFQPPSVALAAGEQATVRFGPSAAAPVVTAGH